MNDNQDYSKNKTLLCLPLFSKPYNFISPSFCLLLGEHTPLARRMSAPVLSSEVQLRYLLQWFSEFSELQREDFLPFLAAARELNYIELASALATLNCQDKPVSLFQCRIKLFNEWYPSWTQEQCERLVKGVTEIDSEFGKKLQECNLTNGTKVNGDLNGFNDDVITPDESQDEEVTASNIETNAPAQEVTEPVNQTSVDEEPAVIIVHAIEQTEGKNEVDEDTKSDLDDTVNDTVPVEITTPK